MSSAQLRQNPHVVVQNQSQINFRRTIFGVVLLSMNFSLGYNDQNNVILYGPRGIHQGEFWNTARL